jgi:hypothetical protein
MLQPQLKGRVDTLRGNKHQSIGKWSFSFKKDHSGPQALYVSTFAGNL